MRALCLCRTRERVLRVQRKADLPTSKRGSRRFQNGETVASQDMTEGLQKPHLTHTTLTWRALLSSPSNSQGHPPSRTAVSCRLPSWLLTCLSRPSDHGTFVSKPWPELRNCVGKEGSREEKRQSPYQAPDPSPQPRSRRLVRDPS